MSHQVSQFPARSNNLWWFMWHELCVFLSLYISFWASHCHGFQWRIHHIILIRLWLFILKMCPDQCSCIFNSITSMLRTFIHSRMSTMVKKWMLRNLQAIKNSYQKWSHITEITTQIKVVYITQISTRIVYRIFHTTVAESTRVRPAAIKK